MLYLYTFMLRVYGYSKYFNSFIAGPSLYVRIRRIKKDGPSAEMVKSWRDSYAAMKSCDIIGNIWSKKVRKTY